MKKVKDYKFKNYFTISSIIHNNVLFFIKGNLHNRKFYNMYNERVEDLLTDEFNESFVVSAKNTNKILASESKIEDLTEFNTHVICNANKNKSSLKNIILDYQILYNKTNNFYEVNCFTEEAHKLELNFDLAYTRNILDNNSSNIPGNVIRFYADENNKRLYFSTVTSMSKIESPNTNLNYYNGIPYNDINEFYEGVFYLKLLNSDSNIRCKLFKLENDKIIQLEY